MAKPLRGSDQPRIAAEYTNGSRYGESSRSDEILTVQEVANDLRCSKAHVHNLINGKVHGVTPMPSLFLGRRRLIRQRSLELWIAQNERRAD
jgi:excisionase family DNA binding protein